MLPASFRVPQIFCIFAHMKKILFVTLSLAIFVAGCAPLRHIEELSKEADAALEAGERERALDLYEQIIAMHRENDRSIDGRLLRDAGLIAFELGETSKAIEYLDPVRHTNAADAQTYRALALSYREIDNLSREIRMLEHYVDNYPEGGDFSEMQHRLFLTYVESLNFRQAYDLWPVLEGSPGEDEVLMSAYLEVLIALDHRQRATRHAEEILAMNRNNLTALDWLARHHFREADTLYRREMLAYEENRTHRQYAQLLDALEIVNTNLRIALDYFTRLYNQNPTGEYASYLANIYERFQDEENARYYRRRAQ